MGTAVALLVGAHLEDPGGLAEVSRGPAPAGKDLAELLEEDDLPGLPEELLPPAHGVQVADVAQDEGKDEVDEDEAAHQRHQQEEEAGVEEAGVVVVLLVLLVERVEVELAEHHEEGPEEHADPVAETQ